MVLLLLSCTLVADRLGTPKDPGDATEHVFTVPKGATARSLGNSLEAEGIIDDAGHFRLYVRLKGEGGCIKAGRFRLRADMSAGQILSTLCARRCPGTILGRDHSRTASAAGRPRPVRHGCRAGSCRHTARARTRSLP